MSIFKDTFKENVANQLKKRQESIFNRTPAAIQYLNSRNAWIRMTSAVNIGPGKGTNTSAKRHVLQGGTNNNIAANNFQLKSGIGKFGDKAYSLYTPDNANESHRLGIRPMPGITSIDIKSKSTYGSLREIVVNFQCWDIRQLEELELLYMRPGYTVLVEWGWAPYLDNEGNLQSNVNFNNDVLYGGKPKETIWKEIYTQASTNGNYDAMYGYVKNYSWSARTDGGYDCTTSIISMGEIIESLKINYSPVNSSYPIKGAFSKLSSPFSKDSNVKKSYSQNIVAGLCNELYLILKDKIGIKNKEEKSFNNWTFFRFDVNIANSQNKENDFDDSTQIYILLKDFVDLLNTKVLIQDAGSKKGIVKISTYEGEHMGGETKPLLCLGHPLQLSIDPSICLIKNNAWLNPSNLGFIEKTTDDFETLQDIMNGLKQSYWYGNDYTKQQLGVIGNIYVNLGYIYSLVNNKNLEAQDKKEKNEIILYDFLKNLLSGINTSIGNVATLDIFSDPIDATARIIDVNYVDEMQRQKAYESAFQFEVQNTKSVIRNYKLESQIFADQSATVAIGAQAQGGALGSDTNTLVDFNKNLYDRILGKKDAPYNLNNIKTDEENIKEQIENLKTNTSTIIEFINEIDPAWYSFGSGNYDVNNAGKYSGALRDIISFYKSLVKDDNKNRAIIPTKLSLEIDGIGGIIIGNLFRIPDEILPKGYRGGGAGPSRIAYAVTGLGHSIQNSDWVTNIDAQFIILDEPQGLGLDISTLKTINTALTSGKSTSYVNTIINREKNKIAVKSDPKDQNIINKYGAVGDKSQLTTLTFPYPMYYGGKLVKSTTVHKLAKDDLEAIFREILSTFGLEKIKKLKLDQFGGLYNVRDKRCCPGQYSIHSWAIAIDLDPANNGLLAKTGEALFSKPEYKPFIDIWYKHGWKSFGKELGYDWMHFQVKDAHF